MRFDELIEAVRAKVSRMHVAKGSRTKFVSHSLQAEFSVDDMDGQARRADSRHFRYDPEREGDAVTANIRPACTAAAKALLGADHRRPALRTVALAPGWGSQERMRRVVRRE